MHQQSVDNEDLDYLLGEEVLCDPSKVFGTEQSRFAILLAVLQSCV